MIALIIKGFQVLSFVFRALFILILMTQMNIKCHAHQIRSWYRTERGGHGNPLQYSCLKNSMTRGAWATTVHGVAKSRTQLSN